MKHSSSISIVVSLILLAGCSDSKVVIQARTGGKQLVYDCNNFRPQVETAEDLQILMQVASETASNAVREQSVVVASEMSEAFEKQDWRRLEKAVVMYKCNHK